MRPALLVLAFGAFAPTSILGAPRPQDQSLAQAGSILKRLTDGARLQPRQDIAGGLELAQDVTQSASTGRCRSECNGWTGALRVRGLGPISVRDTEAIGRCACTSSTLSEMSPCATCFDSAAGYTTFENLCEYLNTGVVPSSSAAASSISSASSASVSASATPASQSSGEATSSAATSSVATTPTEPVITSAPATTASTDPAVTSAAGAATSSRAASSANGRVDLVAGSVIGSFAFLFALLA
ncbi:BZ3500_MvSof-1268-A1-R1_Chr1-1g00870 [Microbotryum saponariae]|uniref:BZ3500_MvSof-1268-A1-R1_Chr1-1g00870 protein n=1 Tax=Microbotryum saponariae TaxID=289078 RepID=A0A2X0KLW2_9BASI|nr:BZ3500_MvSof-1268-A1-R1_Chr1-1g00870 [Microbotryum saponariae]SCZ92818.1 BZ3501_MvSof-1269-A2-R1_Chr1-1g00467 [Microbotryum saponariae]